ncbi:GTPase family protein [Cylindrospermopsis raciborskii]|uniref:GTPase n=1 Tax=Cylindrospermopsis raciborskii CENA302 TaxID=1170768 RepID=A0A9Q5QXV6_9CYAN|nr:GTPase [Cylindrospermopsis raciborskii]NLQ06442.1 GTPase [Cylindrospermopsis raciborskii MVCC19]OHY33269.1 GTPase [Cylindrospermopsis raciborskii MVCC14]OPH10125.1 GTPase [Cylindrospermopsis raciborskii CENA302]
MNPLKSWQWLVLISPIALIIAFVLIVAGIQINSWGLNWIWGIFILIFTSWRWLLVKLTKPMNNQIESVFDQVKKELDLSCSPEKEKSEQVERILQKVLNDGKNDLAIWEDLQTFWQRCQDLVVGIAHIYNPEVKYPLLSIYIPQVYGLIRGTVDDMDKWMQKLSPVLNQVSVGKVYQSYEVYRQLEPAAKKLFQVWDIAQLFLNPGGAIAKKATDNLNNRATQELLINLNQILREATLRNLCQQAVVLYGGVKMELMISELPEAKTQTLRDIIQQAHPPENLEKTPLNILIAGRNGAGKSSVINTIFASEIAEVDVLPSTDKITTYNWQTESGEIVELCDTPGYEQVNRQDFRDLVMDYGKKADLLLLVSPALDPALQMDVDFLEDIKKQVTDLPIIAVVTQVDKLRPIREWQPPYNWRSGNKLKEMAIREAVLYREQKFKPVLINGPHLVLPLVTDDPKTKRCGWNLEELSHGLLSVIDPAKQLRLSRFLRNLETRIAQAAKIIDYYSFQMTTTQGITSLLKNPILQFVATLSTGSPALAYILSEKIPVEQLPVVIGKLQMSYDLFKLLHTVQEDGRKTREFDLLSLWPFLLENSGSPQQGAWSLGYSLIEYWTQDLTIEQLGERFHFWQRINNNNN